MEGGQRHACSAGVRGGQLQTKVASGARASAVDGALVLGLGARVHPWRADTSRVGAGAGVGAHLALWAPM